jgi:hypothetical protein
MYWIRCCSADNWEKHQEHSEVYGNNCHPFIKKIVFIDKIMYNINSKLLKPLNNAQMSGVFLFYGEE